MSLNELADIQSTLGAILHFIEKINDALDADCDETSINRIHDKLNMLVKDQNRAAQIIIAQKTLDKFEDYMKNVDKLNDMINEFKGCVTMARSVLSERKQQDKQV